MGVKGNQHRDRDELDEHGVYGSDRDDPRQNGRAELHKDWGAGTRSLATRDHAAWCKKTLDPCKFCNQQKPDHLGRNCPTHMTKLRAKQARKSKPKDPGLNAPHSDPSEGARARRHARRAADRPVTFESLQKNVGRRDWHVEIKDTYHTNPNYKSRPNPFDSATTREQKLAKEKRDAEAREKVQVIKTSSYVEPKQKPSEKADEYRKNMTGRQKSRSDREKAKLDKVKSKATDSKLANQRTADQGKSTNFIQQNGKKHQSKHEDRKGLGHHGA